MDAFVEKALLLIAQERDAEAAESQAVVSNQLEFPDKLESQGVCLSRLNASSQYIGLYGRQVVVFEQSMAGHRPLPSSSITSGDIVGVFAHAQPVSEKGLSGIVVHKDNVSLTVAFDQLDDSIELTMYDGALLVVKLSNDVTYRRMKRSLEELRAGKCHQHLVRVLFAEEKLYPPDPKFAAIISNPGGTEKFPFFNLNLDHSQRRAVVFALSRPDVAVIHGPPGTGKTTTLVEFILQSVKLGQKVLACAPSNIAVDNMVERLVEEKAKVIRVGHPARLSESVQSVSLDALLHKVDSAEIIMDVRKDIKKALTSLHHCRGPAEKSKWRSEIKTLKKELLNREQRAIKDLLKCADVILATNNGASPDGPLKYLPEDHFSVSVIDECAQAVEASCWIPLLHSPKCVIAGDHMQLPPTILSREAALGGLSVSLIERVTQLHEDTVTAMLITQYRMNKQIMSCSSKFFYDDKLQAHSSVTKHTLCDLGGVSRLQLTSVPLLFIDTSGCNTTELETLDEQSKGNEGEADLVVHHLKRFISAGVSPSHLAVIAPYTLQVELIRKRLVSINSSLSAVEVHTVDGFQGREKEAVVISFTRSNLKGEYGFLSESRRTNVAVTRARRHLTLIGDSGTIRNEPFIREMIEYCHEFGEVWSAHEYMNDPSFESMSYYESTTASKPKKRSAESSRSRIDMMKPFKRKEQVVTSSSSCETVTRSEPTVDTQSYIEPLEAELTDFLRGPESTLKFPSSLTSNERRIIHEMCERMDLLHISKGEGKQRYIEVKKKSTSAKRIPTEIDGLTTNPASITTYVVSTPPQQSDTKKKPTRRKVSKPKPSDKSSSDLDALLSEVTQLDSTCSHQKCKKSVNLVSVKCSFCSRRYCMEHSLPEVHGCGDAARRHARSESASKPLGDNATLRHTAANRVRLQKKLHDKIEKVSQKGRRHMKK